MTESWCYYTPVTAYDISCKHYKQLEIILTFGHTILAYGHWREVRWYTMQRSMLC